VGPRRGHQHWPTHRRGTATAAHGAGIKF
jgi:hypothetical protein